MIKMMKFIFILLSHFGFIYAISACSQAKFDQDSLQIFEDRIEFRGKIYPKRYNTYSDRQNGHHFIVWIEGNNAQEALINTQIPDEKILDVFIKIGVEPGNNLTQETWTERHNQDSNEPDKRVKGSPIRISIEWDETQLPAHQLFKQSDQNDLDLHVGGHRELIPIWNSGCVTCLFSCPGGKTSNAAYTIRDQAYDRKSFVADTEKLPPDGTEVTVIIKLQVQNDGE